MREPKGRESKAVCALVASCALIVSVTGVAEPRVLEYVTLSDGKPTGVESDRYASDGSVESHFEYHDRGRGPVIAARYAYDASGFPVSVEVRGTDYLGAPVDEQMSGTAGGRVWRSAAENGSSVSTGYYVSQDGATFVELAALARLASRTPGQPVALLPGGSATVTPLAEADLSANEHSVRVHAVSISGIGFTPVILWLDERDDFFASVSSYSGTLRRGWEGAAATLSARQSALEDAREKALARSLGERAGLPVAFEHVTVFDAQRAVDVRDQTVVVDGGMIRAVGPAATVPVPAGAMRVDGRGRTLLPGLFDMHMHVSPGDGILCIAAGVTSGRDMGNDIDHLEALRRDWESNVVIGPRLWKAGVIDGPGKYQAPAGIFVDSVPAARAAVARYAKLGYVQIKIYSSLKPELVAPIVAAAHRLGLRVSGHVPQGMTAEQFVRAGVDEIQHVNFLFLNFFPERAGDTRTPERFTVPAQYAAGVDLDSVRVRHFVRLLRAHGTVIDPTLVAFEDMLVGRPGEVAPAYAPIIARLPVQARREALHGGLAVTSASDPVYRASFDAFVRFTGQLQAAGVPLLAGTDSLPGFMLHRELELEVRAGIPPARALQNATWVPAGILKQRRWIGSIQPGKRADLLLVDGDPLVDIRDIRRGRLVMKDGIAFDPARLYAAIGTGPAP